MPSVLWEQHSVRERQRDVWHDGRQIGIICVVCVWEGCEKLSDLQLMKS